MTDLPEPSAAAVARSELEDWWATSIIRIERDEITLRGHPIGQLIGSQSLTEMAWLMLRADLPTPAQHRLFEAALVAGVDHGPQAPSIAAARMAATCGVGLNNAIATGVNLLGDTHGGAGEQAMELYREVLAAEDSGSSHDEAVRDVVARRLSALRYLPGFGHRIHSRDPRRDPLMVVVGDAIDSGAVQGRYVAAMLGIENELARVKGRDVPVNVDGVTAAIYGELGFEPALARGLFVLSRTVGILAHAWEERAAGTRIKGPMPPSIRPRYVPPEGAA